MVAQTWVCSPPREPLLGVGAADGSFSIVDLARGAVTRIELGDHIASAHWTAERLVVATRAGRIHIRDASGATAVRDLRAPQGRVDALAVAVGPDTRIAASGDGGTAVIWDGATGATIATTPAPGGSAARATACVFVTGALAVGYRDGAFDAFADHDLANIAGGNVLPGGVASMAASPRGDRLFLGGSHGGMLSFAVPAWTVATTWKTTPPAPIAVNAIDVAADGSWVAAFSDDTAHAFASPTDRVGHALGHEFYVRSPKPAWSADFIVAGACFVAATHVVATAHYTGEIRLWNDRRAIALDLDETSAIAEQWASLSSNTADGQSNAASPGSTAADAPRATTNDSPNTTPRWPKGP